MENPGRALLEPLSHEELRQHLAEHPLVEGMHPRHLQIMSDIVQQVDFDSGCYLFREGEPADRVYLILHGSVMLETFNEEYGPIPIESLEAGDSIGWSGFIPPFDWRFDAKAVQPTVALVFETARLNSICEMHNDFGYALMKRMAGLVEQRLNATKEHLHDIYGTRK
ncbi:MAG TPA: cyclic nucleotide-binding domain-containing protein [Armatimonadota bacterium]|jgi:CRP-like cAMP-binding protein